MQKAVSQYLAKYAEPECQALTTFPDIQFQYALVIPAYQEAATFCERLTEQFESLSLLTIVVINQPETDTDEEPQQLLFDFFHKNYSLNWQSENIYLFQGESAANAFLVASRFGQEVRIPSKQGVGLARKIGADLACWLAANSKIQSPWSGSTDADAILPSDYFSSMAGKDIQGAGVFDFCHVETEELSSDHAAIYYTTRLYEQWLHYYVAGLAWAGSGYAFHTIGSCLAFHYAGYCQVRGFPKRSGGEDFYLLNKTLAIGSVLLFAVFHLK